MKQTTTQKTDTATPNAAAPKPRTRGTIRKPLITTPLTAADALPGAMLMPLGIHESDPVKALPLVIERLSKAQAEAQAVKKELEDWKRGKVPFDKALEDLAQTVAPSGKSKEWGLVWAAAYLAEVKAKIVSLETAGNWSAAESKRLAEALATEKTFCTTYQKDAAKHASLLQQISGTLGASCEWFELPEAVANLYQRCNSYGNRAEAMGKANTALQVERDDARRLLREKAEALETEHREIEGLRNGNELLGGEVDSLTLELGQAQTEIKSLRLGASITILLLVGGLLGSLYAWGGAPKQLTPGGETAQTLRQGGAK